MNFWEQSCCALSDKMSLEVFSPIWSHVNENEKKKSNIAKFWKTENKWSRDMLKRYISTKFGINLLDRFWENGFYGRRMDRRWTPGWWLCCAVAQSRAKKLMAVEWNLGGGVGVTCIWDTFDLLVFKVILGSFGALGASSYITCNCIQ